MPTPLQDRVRALVDSSRFQWFIVGVIVINAVVLGLETSPELDARWPWLKVVGTITVATFVVEIVLRIYAHRTAFFRDGWSLFDLFVVLIALIPDSAGLGVLRAFRVLRVLRLLSAVRSMRRVVGALVGTLPGMASIGALLVMVIYVAGVMATELFRGIDPEHFGSLPQSLATLFQIMTGDNWSIAVQTVTEAQPASWIFFLLYILVSTFIVLNLFIAVAVDALERQPDDSPRSTTGSPDESDADVASAIKGLQAEIAQLRAELNADAAIDHRCPPQE